MIIEITKNSKYDCWEILRDRDNDGYTTLLIETKWTTLIYRKPSGKLN